MSTLKDVYLVLMPIYRRIHLSGASDEMKANVKELTSGLGKVLRKEQGVQNYGDALMIPEDAVLGAESQKFLDQLKALYSE